MFQVFRVAKEKLPIATKIVESEEFKNQGYKFVTAQSLGMMGEVHYLYVEGDEGFFRKVFDKLTYFVAGLDNLPPGLASEISDEEKAQYEKGKFAAVPSKLKEIEELKGAEATEVADKIKNQDERAQEGLGFIFSS